MDLQTLTISIACIALALALESTILIVWFYRKLSFQIKNLRNEMIQPKDDLCLLVDKLTPTFDYPEEIGGEFDEEKAVPPIAQTEKETLTDENKMLLEKAYTTFYLQFQELADSITIDNLDDKSQEMMRLLLEMGYWLKDFLPVWRNDFNATSKQKENVNSITFDENQWKRRIAEAPLPNGNILQTPLEVIGLVKKLQQHNVTDFRFLISGFRYQQNAES